MQYMWIQFSPSFVIAWYKWWSVLGRQIQG